MVGGAGRGDESEEEDGEDDDDRAGLEGAVVPAGCWRWRGTELRVEMSAASSEVGGWRGGGKGEVEGIFGGADGDAAEAAGALGGADGDELGDGQVGGAGLVALAAVDAGGGVATDFYRAEEGDQAHEGAIGAEVSAPDVLDHDGEQNEGEEDGDAGGSCGGRS